jgi:hypothetical protein
MSGEVSERLLIIVPRFLDFADKYDLLEKLCRRRTGTHLRVEITGDLTEQEAFDTVLRSLEHARSTALPENIVKRLHWLAEHDGKVAQDLLSQVLDREHELIIQTIQDELRQLLSVTTEMTGKSVAIQAQRQVILPGATVQILLTNTISTRKVGKTTMPNEPSPNGCLDHAQPDRRNLVPAENAGTGGSLGPIQNPQDLLHEALQRMPPEKQAEVLGKAADEALRLQVKRKENELDLDIVSDKIDQAGRVARDVAQYRDVSITFGTEHRSKQGDMHIRVQTKEEPRGKQGPCFVATACYGDYDHPTVVQLRQFRDHVLMRSLLGRSFISVYYRYGPSLAAFLKRVPVVMSPVRLVLKLFANTFTRWYSRQTICSPDPQVLRLAPVCKNRSFFHAEPRRLS